MATTTSTDTSRSWYLCKDDGASLVEFTTCYSLSATLEGQVVQAPIEQGSFVSYNKSVSPTTLQAVMIKQGTAAELTETLETVRTLHTGTTLFSFLTPEREYRNMTIETFSYERTREGGTNLLTLELSLKEVKQVTVNYTTTTVKSTKSTYSASTVKDPSAASKQKQGQKQATQTDQPLESAAYSALGEVIPSKSK